MELQQIANELRVDILDMIYSSKAGHIGGDLSSIDIITYLYFKQMNIPRENITNPNRDRFILSKGHSVEALWTTLAKKGIIDKAELKTFSTVNSRLYGHPNNKVEGVEMNTGSLGHGLSVGVGIALAAKLKEMKYKTYVLLGDGELAEGSVWEAAMAAANYKLDSLTAIIDRNELQITNSTEQVMELENIEAKWKSFGWDVVTCDGHDFDNIAKAFNYQNINKPKVIIANTIKGKGIKEAENNVKWHHFVPNQNQYEQARNDLLRERDKLLKEYDNTLVGNGGNNE